MADDQVWIDPEFSPPPPRKGPGRWFQFVGIAAVAVAKPPAWRSGLPVSTTNTVRR